MGRVGGGIGTGKGTGKSMRKLCRNYPLAIYPLVSPLTARPQHLLETPLLRTPAENPFSLKKPKTPSGKPSENLLQSRSQNLRTFGHFLRGSFAISDARH